MEQQGPELVARWKGCISLQIGPPVGDLRIPAQGGEAEQITSEGGYVALESQEGRPHYTKTGTTAASRSTPAPLAAAKKGRF